MFYFLLMYLKPKLLEEPLVLSALVSLFKAHPRVETQLLALRGVLEVLTAELFEAEVDCVAGWHQVVVVYQL